MIKYHCFTWTQETLQKPLVSWFNLYASLKPNSLTSASSWSKNKRMESLSHCRGSQSRCPDLSPSTPRKESERGQSKVQFHFGGRTRNDLKDSDNSVGITVALSFLIWKLSWGSSGFPWWVHTWSWSPNQDIRVHESGSVQLEFSALCFSCCLCSEVSYSRKSCESVSWWFLYICVHLYILCCIMYQVHSTKIGLYINEYS